MSIFKFLLEIAETTFVSNFTLDNLIYKGDDALAALCLFLTAACIFDYRSSRIPNLLMIGILFTGVGWKAFNESTYGVFTFAIQTIIIIIIFYPLYKIGTMGAGDVKLFGVCAGYLPSNKIFLFLFISLLIAAILSLIKLLKERNTMERLQYLADYLCEVARSGKWHLYIQNKKDYRSCGIRLSGPVLIGILLYMAGIY